jgi:hypothetical protein
MTTVTLPPGPPAPMATTAGARLETVRGMGHDLPKGARPVRLDLLDGHARRTGTARSTDATTIS